MWKISKFLSVTFAYIFILSSHLASQANPAQLWHEAVDAIVLLDEREFQIKNNNKAEYQVHQKIIVNNERGKKYGEVIINENKFCRCTKISGRILDLNGKVLKKLNKKEIKKANISPGYILFDDSKYQWFELGLPNFPYIIEYSYEKVYNSLFFWPDWYPQRDIPVLKTIYKLVLQTPIKYRTHYIGFKKEPKAYDEKGNLVTAWELENIEPKIEEDWIPPENDVQMALFFAPDEFQLEDSKGSFESWDKFASWYRQLTSGRYTLLPETRQKIADMISETMSERQKIQKLYSFLQNHTRYVAIYLGLSGWQPQSAQSVYENHYGDCKDLTTLMIAMLREVGITAYPAIIQTRDHGLLIKEFPCARFNHCIAFVPLQSDTVWLECTADFVEAGMLPAADQGCDVLVVKENGAEIVRTPVSNSAENVWTSKIVGRLTSGGTLFFEGLIEALGSIGASRRSAFNDLKPEECQRKVRRIIGKFAPKVDLQEYQIVNLSENFDQPFIIKFKGTVDKFGVTSANRIFINPDILNRQTQDDIPDEEERKFPIHYYYAFKEIDSLVIALPEGFKIEAAPDSINLESPFCAFRTSYCVENGTLKYSRIFDSIYNQIPVVMYEDYRSFVKKIVKSDNAKFVLRKNSSF